MSHPVFFLCSPYVNTIKTEDDLHNYAMSSPPPKSFRLLVEVPNEGEQTLQKVQWMADIMKA